jgi:putative SOS response-associated peptidase YedK
MCGRYSNTGKPGDELQARMAELLRVSQRGADHGYERFNIAPTQEVLAAVEDEHGRRMETLRWGLLPSWTRDAKPRFPMINARAETVLERPAYRELVQQAKHRCLVLADGWYEWQKPENPRQPRRPVHFSMASGEPFCFAGLWASESAPSCTIVTCAANAIARPIHDRMPVVLSEPAAWEAWLDPALDGTVASELLVPPTSGELSIRPANPVVNSVENDGPECLSECPPERFSLQASFDF